ncbi:unnamed protein product, partial [Rotaria socialis]
TKHNRIEEHFKRTENDLAQLRTIRSTQDAEIVTFKTVGNEVKMMISHF